MGVLKRSTIIEVHYIRGSVILSFQITFKLISLKLRLFSVLLHVDMNKFWHLMQVTEAPRTKMPKCSPPLHTSSTVQHNSKFLNMYSHLVGRPVLMHITSWWNNQFCLSRVINALQLLSHWCMNNRNQALHIISRWCMNRSHQAETGLAYPV
jgi:hypothetical protein